MKRLLAIALALSFGAMTVGCDKTNKTQTTDEHKVSTPEGTSTQKTETTTTDTKKDNGKTDTTPPAVPAK